MKNIIKSLVVVVAVAAVAGGATYALFSDTETSVGNTFTAGTLDLNIDGGNTNVVKFNVNNMRPGNQPTGKYTFNNVGSLKGYLNIKDIAVTSNENVRTEPEIEAGDVTDGNGELQDVVNMRLYWDNDCNGSYSTGDVQIYSGATGSVASSYSTNKALAAGSSQCLMAVFDWWPNSDPYNGTPYHYGDDNLAQSDSMTLDFTFELDQNTI